MKRVSLLIVIAAALAVVFLGCSKGHESTKSAGDLTITLSVARYPLVKSDNTLTVKVTDAAGAAMTDGAVNVRYYMPPMAGMAPMDFNTQATLKGNGYAFSANIPMEGVEGRDHRGAAGQARSHGDVQRGCAVNGRGKANIVSGRPSSVVALLYDRYFEKAL